MPRDLTQQQMMYIVEHMNTHKSGRQIAKDIGCSESAVRKVQQKWRETGSIEHRLGAGRPRALNDKENN